MTDTAAVRGHVSSQKKPCVKSWHAAPQGFPIIPRSLLLREAISALRRLVHAGTRELSAPGAALCLLSRAFDSPCPVFTVTVAHVIFIHRAMWRDVPLCHRVCVRDSSHTIGRNSIRDTFFFFFSSIHFNEPSGLHLIALSSCTVAAAVLSAGWTDLPWQWLCQKKKEGKEKKRKEKGTASSHTGVWILTVSFSALRSRSEMIPLWTWPYLCLTYLRHHKCNRPPGRHKTHFQTEVCLK